MNTPRFEYSRSKIQDRINYLKALEAPFGLTLRYAMKANPHPEIIHMMEKAGIYFDASSSYEATELLKLGVEGSRISLSSQQSPHNLDFLLSAGVNFVATSFKQLELFLASPVRSGFVSVRINPNLGEGHNNRTSTGGVSASFGIWFEYIDRILKLTSTKGVMVNRLHIHIGSGAKPSVWEGVMERALEIVQMLPDVTVLDIGGGYKIHRFGEEEETDMVSVMKVFTNKLEKYASASGRKLHLEIEPGTYFIAHAGTLVAEVDDIVDTGSRGFTFLRLNTGMNDFLRSAMYGARHEMEVMNNSETFKDYVVVGHNCETGDIFTPLQGDPEHLEVRKLKEASIGDEIRIYDTGAYCASMRARGYNSFPDAEELMVD